MPETLAGTSPRQLSAADWFARREPCAVERVKMARDAYVLLKSWLQGVAAWNEESKREALRCAKRYRKELGAL